MSVVDDIKNQISIEHVLSDYGIYLRKGRCRCPLHGGDNPTSFSVRDGRFRCFACGESGDVISLVQKLDHLDFSEAVRYLGQKAGISGLEFSRRPNRKREKMRAARENNPEREENRILDSLIRLWEQKLKTLDNDLRNSKIELAKYYTRQQLVEYCLSRLDELAIQRQYETNIRRKS